jgi:hypothetical protein
MFISSTFFNVVVKRSIFDVSKYSLGFLLNSSGVNESRKSVKDDGKICITEFISASSNFDILLLAFSFIYSYYNNYSMLDSQSFALAVKISSEVISFIRKNAPNDCTMFIVSKVDEIISYADNHSGSADMMVLTMLSKVVSSKMLAKEHKAYAISIFNLYKESYDASLFKVSLMSLVNLNDVKTYSLNELLLPENKESKKRKNK